MSESSSSTDVPMSAEEQMRQQRQVALLDSLMERKLANLNREYDECLAAGDPANRPNMECVEVTAEEYNEAWEEYQQACREEMEDMSSGDDFDSGDDGESCAAEPETLPEPEPLHKPLTEDKITSIKSVMSGIRLRPPPWALGQPEEVWMAQIMRRTGFVNPAAKQSTIQQSPETQSSLSSQSAPVKPKKNKSKKKKAAKKAAREAAKAQFDADFEAQFPPTVTDPTTTQA